tara:strand:- start:939 stop:1862 length:924 start_codon:yes stop_codon:yes gene_type:complete
MTNKKNKLIDGFLDYMLYNKGLSKLTIKSYKVDLYQFADYISHAKKYKSILSSTTVDVQNFIGFISMQKVASKTLSRKLATLKSFYKYLAYNDLVKMNICKNIKFPKNHKRLPQFLNENEVNELLNYPCGNSYNSNRDKAILELFYGTGIRVSELASIKINDIDLDKCSINIKGKGSKRRIVLFGKGVKEIIIQYLKKRSENRKFISNKFLFSQIRSRDGKYLNHISERTIFSIVKKYMKKISNNEKLSPHSLRHSFATHLLDNGADLITVKDLLGHSSLSSTQIYTHLQIDKLKKTYNQAHPHGDK